MTIMSDAEWRASLAPGDEIAIRHSFGGGHSIGTVVRRDKVKIIVSVGTRDEIFSAKLGTTLGADSLSAREITPLTDAIRALVHRARLVKRVENTTTWYKMPTAALESICSILDSVNP